ncbi:MAG TPA: putative Ig domain-containing protein [Tepidisphaeraceae bacterium]|nr:putative Ig domain-containing protein [Tepidisphaeraceae bacterium]
MKRCLMTMLVASLCLCAPALAQTEPSAPEIRTPPAADTPRINGPSIYGERPGRPFLYSIPATGRRPMLFAASGLPDGLSLDPISGRITGSVANEGRYAVTLTASNSLGKDEKSFQIVIGDQICLTPPMGWNSWNCFAGSVDQKKVEAIARVIYLSGLSQHGWTYVNLDDTWQGLRSGPDHALQANAKFPDMKGMCDLIHSLGLKAGIYSTPWVTSYAGYCGGSAMNPDGSWSKPTISKRGNVNKKILPWAIGKYHFMRQDARQWAAWGFDYLKYDWNPIEPPDVIEMADALKSSGRDFVYSLSNSAPFSGAADWAKYSNAWRTCSDIRDTWALLQRNGLSPIDWQQFAGPGHWNDPDMLEVGYVGGAHMHRSRLTPDEQYAHITVWCMLSAPLLMGCDLTRLDDFTYNLLSNDEVLAVDQDALGKQATRISSNDGEDVWVKPLADGTWAVAFVNRGTDDALMTLKFSDLKLTGSQKVRDLWREKDLDDATDSVTISVAAHGAEMLKIGQADTAAATQPAN